MGIKERQGREREAMRRAILDAARDLFVAEGYHNVSIRKIAERIEYSPAAIYGYFPSKDDIFFELAEEGFRLLSRPDHFEQLDTLAPLERIRQIFWRLYEFSVEQPEYFSLMFVDRSVPRITREYERFAFVRDIKARIAGYMQQAVEAGALPATTRPMVAFRLLTMALVGVVVARLSDRLAPGEDADALARDVLEVMLAGLQSGVELRAQAAECPLDAIDADVVDSNAISSTDRPTVRSDS